MNLVVYRHYNKDSSKGLIQSDMDNGDYNISYVSGKEDIITILKELIKTKYTV